MQTKIRVSVTPYVHAYLATRYGPSPYDLTHSHRNDLRMAFSYMWMGVEFWPRIKHGHYVVIDLGKDHSLLRAYEYNRPFLKAGHFFQGEFMRAMRGYVRAQEALAKSLNLGPSSWNKKWAIDQFLKEHNVDPASYDFFSAYRQHNRMEQADFSELAQKVSTMFKFRAADNECFRLCSVSIGKRNRIIFWCYSRSQQDMRRCSHYIPQKLIKKGDWLGYTKTAMTIINDFLIKGYTVS